MVGIIWTRGVLLLGDATLKPLKEQCHEIFDHFFMSSTNSTWAPYEQL